MSDHDLFWFAVGWLYAPLLIVPAVGLLWLWRKAFPLPVYNPPSFPVIPPPEPPPALTDQEYRRLMTQARLMRKTLTLRR
jgi:hypothetical protein